MIGSLLVTSQNKGYFSVATSIIYDIVFSYEYHFVVLRCFISKEGFESSFLTSFQSAD